MSFSDDARVHNENEAEHLRLQNISVFKMINDSEENQHDNVAHMYAS